MSDLWQSAKNDGEIPDDSFSCVFMSNRTTYNSAQCVTGLMNQANPVVVEIFVISNNGTTHNAVLIQFSIM